MATSRRPDLDAERPWDAAEQRRIREWQLWAEGEIDRLRRELALHLPTPQSFYEARRQQVILTGDSD